MLTLICIGMIGTACTASAVAFMWLLHHYAPSWWSTRTGQQRPLMPWESPDERG
jgi:hypothetical protein